MKRELVLPVCLSMVLFILFGAVVVRAEPPALAFGPGPSLAATTSRDVALPAGYRWRPGLGWVMSEIMAALALDPQRTVWWLADGQRLAVAVPELDVRRPLLRYRLT
jgi:hypothetical protein